MLDEEVEIEVVRLEASAEEDVQRKRAAKVLAVRPVDGIGRGPVSHQHRAPDPPRAARSHHEDESRPGSCLQRHVVAVEEEADNVADNDARPRGDEGAERAHAHTEEGRHVRVRVALGEDGLRDQRDDEEILLREQDAERLLDVGQDRGVRVQLWLDAVEAPDLVRPREEEGNLARQRYALFATCHRNMTVYSQTVPATSTR